MQQKAGIVSWNGEISLIILYYFPNSSDPAVVKRASLPTFVNFLQLIAGEADSRIQRIDARIAKTKPRNPRYLKIEDLIIKYTNEFEVNFR